MSISGPTSRLTAERIELLAPQLKRISRDLSAVLSEPQKYNESA